MSGGRTENASFTPGPWSVPHFAKPDVDCECGYVLTERFMGAVCTVHASGEGDWKKTGDNPPFEEACANARLIAAAPELLHALEMVRDADNDRIKDAESPMPIAARATIDAAIAKALGK